MPAFQFLTEWMVKPWTWLSGPSRSAVFSPFSQAVEPLATLSFMIPDFHRDLCFGPALLLEFPRSESSRFREF
jgi:hypothetical protein